MVKGPTKGWAAGQDGAEIFKPPLVTLVVINWNYAAYVGAAIDLIKSQDYSSLEAIVVDNGSTDTSRDVIAKHVGEDLRFRIVHLDRNLGQLGAYFDVFKLIRGDFVTIVDADDVLFPNFVSSHVQVHLALPISVALTSSNVVEMTAQGRALTGGYANFAYRAKPAARGLRTPEAAVRLATVTDADFRQLALSTVTYVAGGCNWIWGPGTSNMFRRSTLLSVQQEPQDRSYFRAADNYLNPLCHVIGGSALIDLHLSAYRVHNANYFALRETVGRVRAGRVEFTERRDQERGDLLRFLLSRAEAFGELLGSGFWTALKQLLEGMSKEQLSRPDTRKLLVDKYAALRAISGESRMLSSLGRLGNRNLRSVIREAHGGSIPAHLKRSLLKDRSVSARSAVRKIVRKLKKIAEEKAPLALMRKGPYPGMSDSPQQFGPVAALSFDPPIFLTGMAFQNMIGIATAFGKRYGSVPAAFLIYPCWSIEDQLRSGQVIEAARAHQTEYRDHELVFLCNSARERDLLAQSGLTACLLNKNLTVSETIFRPLPNAKIEFDAVYTARFDPRKRHELAAAIARLAYLSCDDSTSSEGTRKFQCRLLTQILTEHPDHALINPIENGLPMRLPPEGVNAALNRAAVGLCLSNLEGSNYASMEYLLAGLPVVSTPSVGGREVYFDHEYCTICEPTPEAVRDAVEALKARRIPRDYIRVRTLAKIEPERRRFLSLIDDLSERLGGKRRYDGGIWPFGATSALVSWKNYRDHLLDFDKGARGVDHDTGWQADGDSSLAEAEGIQMQAPELQTIIRAIRSRRGCSLLVFGCGNDSKLWEDVNRGGTTVFLEDDPAWADKIQPTLTTASVHLVQYSTKLSEWVSLLYCEDRLELDLPDAVSSRHWDVILVDGPAGFHDHDKYFGREAPGRMQSIYMASKLVAPGGYVFVHDCERLIEQRYAAHYLGNSRIFVRVEGRAMLQGYSF